MSPLQSPTSPRTSRTPSEVSVADFRARFPEFASNTDDQVAAAIEDALPWNGRTRWDRKWVLGVCTLAAHMLALTNQRAQSAEDTGGGAATGIYRFALSRRAGALQVTYGTTGTSTTTGGPGQVPYFLSLTTYGIQWWSMARIVGMGAIALKGAGLLPGTAIAPYEPPDDFFSGRTGEEDYWQ